MTWDDARLLDSICYDLVLGDYPRGLNRAKINDLANGCPPFTEKQVEENGIQVNYSDLSMTKRLHEARSQILNGFFKTANYFTCRTDMGPIGKRSQYGAILTRLVNRPLKRSVQYFESIRAKASSLCLHGIAPAVWETEDAWCTTPIGVEDVLVPSNTLLGFKNLPFLILRRSYTGIELQRLTDPATRDPGWNMDLVERIMKWLDSQTMQLRSSNWPEIWSPEKVSERVKQDGGYYLGDQVPTIDCFDIYGYVSDSTGTGWVRRMILDSWGAPAQSGLTDSGRPTYTMNRDRKKPMGDDAFKKDDFLFTSGPRKVAKSWQNVISFNFADLSPVAPNRYHSTRSLGFLLYAVCHLQNRVRCKFNEAVLEALMMYFKVKSMDDVQRALKLDLVNRGFIDDTITPLTAQERYQVNSQLVELGMQDLANLIQDGSSTMSQRREFSDKGVEKTRFQVMAEVNADTSLIGAALSQAYQYQVFEDREVFRRFCNPYSQDADVMEVRAAALRLGGQKLLDLMVPEYWDIEHERVMGGGNKTLEMTISQQLMEWRALLDPPSQRKVLRDSILAITDDAAKSNELVPEEPAISSTVHDTELVFSALMADRKIDPAPGLNPVEVVGTMLKKMAETLAPMIQGQQPPDAKDLAGLTLCEQYTAGFLKQLAQDKSAKQMVRGFTKVLKEIMDEVRTLAQKMQQQMAEHMQAQQAATNGGNGGLDPKDAAKIKATEVMAQTKSKLHTERSAQRAAQDQVRFEQQLRQQAQQHEADVAAKDLQTAAEIHRNRLKSLDDDESRG